MSMARSTPAQKPRGPARRISEMADLIAALASTEIVRYSDHADMGFPPPVRPGRVGVGAVLEAVAAVDRGRVGEEDGRADPAPHQERQARGERPHPETGPPPGAAQPAVGHDPPEPRGVVP